jgi:hypothetical protein
MFHVNGQGMYYKFYCIINCHFQSIEASLIVFIFANIKFIGMENCKGINYYFDFNMCSVGSCDCCGIFTTLDT